MALLVRATRSKSVGRCFATPFGSSTRQTTHLLPEAKQADSAQNQPLMLVATNILNSQTRQAAVHPAWLSVAEVLCMRGSP